MSRSGISVYQRFALLGITAAALTSCTEGTSPEQTVFGPVVTVGTGTARTYVQISSAGEPLAVGVVLSETALAGLPATGTVYVLALPAEAPIAPYNHATLNWQPAGHPPPGIFTVPHFDVHFYMVTQAEVAAITPTDPQFAVKAAVTPSAEFIPAGYVRDPGAVPNMGTHWTDPASPEFNGQPFTKTFLYGSWNGTFTFYEPMGAKSFLESKPAIAAVTLKLPSRYAKPGYHPTTYTVGFDATAKEYVIALTGLVPRS